MLFDNSVENTNISIINNSFIRNNVDPDNTNPYGEFYEILFRSVVGGGKPAPTGTINNNYFLLENSTGYYGTDTGTPLSGFSVYDNTVENY
jgi:hypothetical protein